MSIIRMFSSEVVDTKIKINNNDRSVATKFAWNGDKRICIPRNNQQDVMDRHMYAKYLLMIQPPGSGKSMTIGFCMAQRLTENPNEKVLIAVPQTMISKSFGKTILRLQDDDVEWDISNNLCVNTKKEKGVELRDFLRTTQFNDGINSRIAICTHMTLASMTRELKIHPELLKNTTLIIDEAHHILYPENGSGKSVNRIGKLLKIQLKKEEPTFSLWLVTATFYRGDRGTVLPSHHMDKFEKYFLPMDVHWKENIQYIKKFNLDFVVFNDNDPITEIKEVLKLGKRKSIIYCPCTGKLLQDYGNKYEFRDAVINVIYEIWPECNILDLIEENGRENQKVILEDDNLSKDIDIILAIKLLDEGTDWKFAEQALNISPSESLRIENQRFGRLWRDVPGKEEIFYYVFLPKEANFKDEEERRLHVSKACTAFIATMLLEEIIEPILYPRLATEVKSESEGKSNERPLTPIEVQIPDETKRQTVIADVTKELMFLRNIKEDPTPEQVQERIFDVLDKYNIKKDREAVAKHIIIMLRRRYERIIQPTPQWEKQIKSVNVQWMVEAGFDKVWTNDIFDTLLTFTTGSCGIETFEEFRKIYSSEITLDESVEKVNELIKENNGYIPIEIEIHPTLRYWIKNYPERFKGKKQLFKIPGETDEIFIKTLGENDDHEEIVFERRYLQVQGILKDQENNILPTHNDIARFYNPTIAHYVKAHEERFDGIKQYFGNGSSRVIKILNTNKVLPAPDKPPTLKNINTFIEKAKKYEEKFGYVPSQLNLNKLGEHSLCKAITKFPEQFGDIKIRFGYHNKIISIKDLVKARKERNDEIVKNKQTQEEIKEIKKSRKSQLENLRARADKLKDKDGVLPQLKSILKIDSELYYAIKCSPQNFDGYKQYKGVGNHQHIVILNQDTCISKPDDSLVKDAVILREDGIIPAQTELKKMGRTDIFNKIKNSPQLFEGLKQRVIKSRTGKIGIRIIGGKKNVIPAT